ncbi:MAG: RagB/SusD family nutrient uptake outer membrane protein [Muribaculaceae bacterium]|nr:RagB/SusD family nutrient uptake outer membrane protein [Muribaculaceae bacterium]
MKLRYIFTGIIAAGVILTMSSCNKLLDIPQHSVAPIDSFYQTDEEAEQGIVAAYYQFKTSHSGGTSSALWLMNFLGDDVWTGGGNRTDGIYYQYCEYTFGSDNSTVKNLYQGLYTLIYRCNLIIERVKPESEIKSRAIAEAKVMRAWADFELASLWGTAPVVDHILKPDEYLKGNSQPGELYAAAEKDLTEAIQSGKLTQKKNKNDLTYRMTKEFAMALLGKVYLWQGKNSEAFTQFDAIISSGLYELQADLTNFGTIKGDVSPEDLFCMRGIDDASNSAPNSHTVGMWTGLRAEKYNYESNAPFCTYTFGFQSSPTKKLYDTFVKIEGENGYRLKNFVCTYDRMISEFGTSVKDGMSIYDNEGFFTQKYRTLKDNGSAYRYPLPDHIMRYDEVLCFAAEAAVLTNKGDKAVEYINTLRRRAKAPEVASVDLQTVKDESYVELCFEGVRFQNLVRWGDAAAALAGRGESGGHIV